ncbi:MAG TPA: DUF1461 domain-containing protein [Leucothrix sp.]|nr:DUF1461 domain-containing protein [Leucothrix sp.]
MKKIYWGFFLILTFLTTLPASWWLLSKADFFYSSLYDNIGIAEHIAKYAPKNLRGRMDFESTSKTKRVDLFHGIVEAINHHGDGLKNLFYKDVNNQLQPLLTLAEVIHLQDVANLLDRLKILVIGFILIWLVIVTFFRIRKVTLPSAKELFINASIVIVLLLSAVLLISPVKVFNQLHIWVFPDNHQWFFYYEESLMSTMMKAPDLFGYIAGIWGVLSIILTLMLLLLLKFNKNINPVLSRKYGSH